MTEWIEFVKKTTVEHSTKAFAKNGPQPEETSTERVWYVNKDILASFGAEKVLSLIKELPEL